MATRNAPIGTSFFPKFFIYRIQPPSPLRLSYIPAKHKAYYAKEKFIILMFTFLLMNSLGKQAVSQGSIKQRVEMALSFLVVCFFIAC